MSHASIGPARTPHRSASPCMNAVALKTAALDVVIAALAATCGPHAHAGTATAPFQVTLTIQAACTISANALNFGTNGVLASNIDQSTTLTVTCSTGSPYTVSLDAGTTTGSTIPNRLLTNSGATVTVSFNLYQDAARTQIWGQTVGTNTVAGTGTGAAQTLTVFGRVPPQNTPAPNTYQTTVTATVAF
nr:spore coat U domain-containing protein [Paraburkholderia bannensis]